MKTLKCLSMRAIETSFRMSLLAEKPHRYLNSCLHLPSIDEKNFLLYFFKKSYCHFLSQYQSEITLFLVLSTTCSPKSDIPFPSHLLSKSPLLSFMFPSYLFLLMYFPCFSFGIIKQEGFYYYS